jgi:enoyl-CoA hydratase/carnithine racemase
MVSGAARCEWGFHDILTLTLDRPDRLNALDPELLSDLVDSLTTDGARARVVILRGAGSEAAVQGTKASLTLLERRATIAEDLDSAQQLRIKAAGSPERHEALKRRQRSLARRSSPPAP